MVRVPECLCAPWPCPVEPRLSHLNEFRVARLEAVFAEGHLALDEVPAGADPLVCGVGPGTTEKQEIPLEHTVLALGVEGGHQDVLVQF